ncbi:tRNA 2-thiouridine(34) synthase MnmA [Patescibacteria group bacterium]|nr:tRNA 2-thiouridine(34) synthase MnmA [Patescibacteria group bacterium]
MINKENKPRIRTFGSVRGKKVIVAMSGGVDSSVAAALLKRDGFDVVGVHLKFWSEGKSSAENRCCTLESEKRARIVAKKLNIPFYVFNFEKEFKRKVVGYFLKEYRAGRTPNPCVVCNKEIKFGLLIEKALKLGEDFVATGHYARLGREIPNPKSQTPNKPKTQNPKPIKLFKAKDENKDQSYFLWQLNQRQLNRVLFPIGNYTKPQVRALAKKFKLPVAETPESQEVCFIKNKTNDFLKKYIKIKIGEIRDKQGRLLGEHQGLCFYTIGQRKGIGLPGGPYYVLDKDIKKNILVVTQDEKDLLRKDLIVGNVNWISGKKPRLREGYSGQAKMPIKVMAKIRYRNKGASAVIKKAAVGEPRQGRENRKIKVIFSKPQRAITSGQSAVFYRGGELLGGGVIE